MHDAVLRLIDFFVISSQYSAAVDVLYKIFCSISSASSCASFLFSFMDALISLNSLFTAVFLSSQATWVLIGLV